MIVHCPACRALVSAPPSDRLPVAVMCRRCDCRFAVTVTIMPQALDRPTPSAAIVAAQDPKRT